VKAVKTDADMRKDDVNRIRSGRCVKNFENRPARLLGIFCAFDLGRPRDRFKK